MTALYLGIIVPIARCVVICAISVVACCGCSRQKTSAAKSGYKPAVEKAETVPVAKSPVTGSKQDAASLSGPSGSDASSRESGASEAELVENDVRTLQNAAFDGDVDVVLEYTHPKIIEMLGGREKAKEDFQPKVARHKSLGMKVDSLTFPNTPTFLKSDTNEFVVVPTLILVSANGQKVEALNYQVGTRKIGTSKWTYIEGSRLKQQNVRDFLPDFPADYEFPKFYRKKL